MFFLSGVFLTIDVALMLSEDLKNVDFVPYLWLCKTANVCLKTFQTDQTITYRSLSAQKTDLSHAQGHLTAADASLTGLKKQLLNITCSHALWCCIAGGDCSLSLWTRDTLTV